MQIPEADWKTLKQLKPIALERLSRRILDECREICSDETDSAHARYLKLYGLIERRNDQMARAFDDMRRSTAVTRLKNMRRYGLVTDAELAQFSAQTQASVAFVDR